MLENTEGAITKGGFRDTGNIDEEEHNTICFGYHYTPKKIT